MVLGNSGSWRCCETSEGDESINAPSTPPPRSSSPDMLPKEPTGKYSLTCSSVLSPNVVSHPGITFWMESTTTNKF